jgi:hypothetical protein
MNAKSDIYRASDIHRAIEELRVRVRKAGGFQAQKIPAIFLTILFERLHQALQEEQQSGAWLDPADAVTLLEERAAKHTPDRKALNNAIAVITTAMNKVQDDPRPFLPPEGCGLACIRYTIDQNECFVRVTGPRVPDRPYLRFEVHITRVEDNHFPDSQPNHDTPSKGSYLVDPDRGDEKAVSAVMQDESWQRTTERLARLLPPAFEDSLSRIARQLLTALKKFENPQRHADVIRAQILTVVATLDHASLELCRGHIVTDYDDCSLLTDAVTVMGKGDELLGLTEWEQDCHWWEREDGRRFREANAQAVARGAVIRRIFLHPTASENNALRSNKQREMDAHRKLNVDARTISLHAVQRFWPDIRQIRSMCVLRSAGDGDQSWGWLTYRVEERSDGWRNCFSVRSQDIKENRLLLEEIWNRAKT